MNSWVWLDLLDEGISLFLMVALALAFYRGYKRNHALLSEREDLLRRYLLFRGDKQVRLKVFGENEKASQELLRTISNSWKNFKKTHDTYLSSLAQNTKRTQMLMQVITLCLVFNTLRLLIVDYASWWPDKIRLLYSLARELGGYVLVILTFALLRIQTRRFVPSKGSAVEADRELLFFPNGPSEGESEGLYNEFDPLESHGEEHGKEDQHPSG
jgi:hypothetical protein